MKNRQLTLGFLDEFVSGIAAASPLRAALAARCLEQLDKQIAGRKFSREKISGAVAAQAPLPGQRKR
jgi:hypothetical protein